MLCTVFGGFFSFESLGLPGRWKILESNWVKNVFEKAVSQMGQACSPQQQQIVWLEQCSLSGYAWWFPRFTVPEIFYLIGSSNRSTWYLIIDPVLSPSPITSGRKKKMGCSTSTVSHSNEINLNQLVEKVKSLNDLPGEVQKPGKSVKCDRVYLQEFVVAVDAIDAGKKKGTTVSQTRSQGDVNTATLTPEDSFRMLLQTIESYPQILEKKVANKRRRDFGSAWWLWGSSGSLFAFFLKLVSETSFTWPSFTTSYELCTWYCSQLQCTWPLCLAEHLWGFKLCPLWVVHLVLGIVWEWPFFKFAHADAYVKQIFYLIWITKLRQLRSCTSFHRWFYFHAAHLDFFGSSNSSRKKNNSARNFL